jgi:DNA-binding NarL/FixJ family response regulator
MQWLTLPMSDSPLCSHSPNNGICAPTAPRGTRVEASRESTGAVSLMDLLTPRQFEVAILIAWGLKNADIATRLRTTEYVIKNYVKEIYDRAGCWNRVELALRFVYENHTGLYDADRLQGFVGALADG